jgi:hypothetical protein
MRKLFLLWFLVCGTFALQAQNANSCSGNLPTPTGVTIPSGQRSAYAYPANHYQCYVCSTYTSVVQVQLSKTDPQTNATTNWWEIIYNNFTTLNPAAFTPPGGLSWNTSTSSATDPNRFLPNTCGTNTGPCGAIQICGNPSSPTRVNLTPPSGIPVWKDSVEIPYRSRGTLSPFPAQTVESGQTGVPVVGSIPRVYMYFRINNLITKPTFGGNQTVNNGTSNPLALSFSVGTGGGLGAWNANTSLVAQLLNLNGTIANASIGTKAAPTTTGCNQAQTLNATIPSGTAVGKYLVRVIADDKRDTGFVSTDTITVCSGTIPSAPGTITGSTTPCGSTSYSVATVSGATSYNWILPSGWVITAGLGTINITVTPGQAGTISVKAVNGCGESGASPALNVTPAGTPAAAGTITGSATPCASAQYTVGTVSGATSYTWNLPTGWVITAGANTNTITVTPGQAGNITVSGVNNCGSGTASPNKQVTPGIVPAAPSAIQGTATPCTTVVSYSVPAVSGATSYNWTVPNGWSIVGGINTNQITLSIVGTSPGTISVRASNLTCGAGASTSLLITPTTLPTTPTSITGPAAICETGSQYIVAPVAGATSYNWTVPTGWAVLSGAGNDTVIIAPAVGATTGSISAKAANACGESVNAASLNVTSVVVFSPSLGISGSGTVSHTTTGAITTNYTASPATYTSYIWTVTNGTITAGAGTSSVTVTWNAAPPQFPNAAITMKAISATCTSVVVSRTITHNWVTGIEDLLAPGTSLSVGPNPNAGVFGLQFELRRPAQMSFRMVDLAGREVMNARRESLNAGLVQREVSMNLPDGIYIMELTLDGVRTTHRIVLQH